MLKNSATSVHGHVFQHGYDLDNFWSSASRHSLRIYNHGRWKMHDIITHIILTVCFCAQFVSCQEDKYVYTIVMYLCRKENAANVTFHVKNKKNDAYREFKSQLRDLDLSIEIKLVQSDGPSNNRDICSKTECDLEIRAWTGPEKQHTKICWGYVSLKPADNVYEYIWNGFSKDDDEKYDFFVTLNPICHNNKYAPTRNGEDRPDCSSTTPCKQGEFGDKCKQTCHWCKNRHCDRSGDGECLDNMCTNPNKTGRKCDIECKVGRWGMKLNKEKEVEDICHRKCYCRDKSKCNGMTGECIDDLCAPGYKSGCQEKCEPRKWGSNCDKDCQCVNDEDCYHDGRCPNGNKNCSEIQIRYGPVCDMKCHCVNDEPCHNQTGTCVNGCALRYYGADCQRTCEENKYQIDNNCTGECHCIGNKCRASNGMCIYGCSTVPIHFWGPTCQNRCNDSFHCVNAKGCFCSSGGSTCKNKTSECPDGCELRQAEKDCQMICRHNDCRESCPKNHFMKNGKCDGKCHCALKDHCRVFDGKCVAGGCLTGWQGDDCQTQCNYGLKEHNCVRICHCKDDDVCNRVSGYCPNGCKLRYYGKGCTETCIRGRFLKRDNCSGDCKCLNVDKCNAKNGECTSGGCTRGWTGKDCQTPCDQNKRVYGENCKRQCHCENNDTCDVVTGYCETCHHRFFGDSCENTCPLGKFRKDCMGDCHCKDNNNCEVIGGTCKGKCAVGWEGESCQRKCGNNTWGEDCRLLCHCANSAQCNYITGKCDSGCDDRHTGKACEETCNDTFYMNTDGNCVEECRCENYTKCRVKDGLCSDGRCKSSVGREDKNVRWRCLKACEPGKYRFKWENDSECKHTCHCSGSGGGYQCDVVGGECPSGCSVRYTGTSCNDTCPDNIFKDISNACTGTCNCANHTFCHVTDGSCVVGDCNEGYKGSFCNETCDDNMYGANCHKRCHCYNNARCNHVTGYCENGCDVRYYGRFCNKTCKRYTYLVKGKCDGHCSCLIADECSVMNGTCDRSGCVAGRKGPKCETYCSKRFGRKCEKRCHCYQDAQCDIDTGRCARGCDYRHTGADCQTTCPKRTYLDAGFKCSKKCHCYKNAECDLISGVCPGYKCMSVRFRGHNCQDNCTHNFYKINGICSGRCHCADPNHCDVSTGLCGGGECAPGWLGEKCDVACEDGNFGPNCSRKCHCKFNRPCVITYGNCVDGGCADGFGGSNCQHKAEHANIAENIAIYTGVFVGFGFLTISFGFIRRWRNIRKKRLERDVLEIEPTEDKVESASVVEIVCDGLDPCLVQEKDSIGTFSGLDYLRPLKKQTSGTSIRSIISRKLAKSAYDRPRVAFIDTHAVIGEETGHCAIQEEVSSEVPFELSLTSINSRMSNKSVISGISQASQLTPDTSERCPEQKYLTSSYSQMSNKSVISGISQASQLTPDTSERCHEQKYLTSSYSQMSNKSVASEKLQALEIKSNVDGSRLDVLNMKADSSTVDGSISGVEVHQKD